MIKCFSKGTNMLLHWEVSVRVIDTLIGKIHNDIAEYSQEGHLLQWLTFSFPNTVIVKHLIYNSTAICADTGI